MAEIRAHSYEAYCWPSFLSSAFRHHNLLTGLGLAAGLIAVMLAAVLIVNDGVFPRPVGPGDFYGVLPHDVMVALFGGVFLFVVVAIGIGVVRFWRDVRGGEAHGPTAADLGRALRDVLTLRHLHGSGVDCTSAEEQRDAAATLVPPLHVLRIPAVFRVDVGGGPLSHRVRMAGAVSATAAFPCCSGWRAARDC